MRAVLKDTTGQPHCHLTLAIGEFRVGQEGWAGWEMEHMPRGFLTQSKSRAPQGRARYCPQGCAQVSRCWQVPRQVLGIRRLPVPPQDAAVSRDGASGGTHCSGVPCPFTGHCAARAWPSGQLGQTGLMLSPARACGPLRPADSRARKLPLDSPWPAPAQCSQTLPLLPAPSLTPSPIRPGLQAAPASLPPAPCSFPSHPALLSPLFSPQLQAMAAAVALFLAALATQAGLKSSCHIDVATAERMQQREEYLREKMTWLLQEIERSGNAEESMLLCVLQHWLFQVVVGTIFVAAWLFWRSELLSDSRGEQDSSSRKEEDDDDVEEQDFNASRDGVRSLAVSTPWTMQGLPDTCKVVREMVGDLLAVCQVLCKRTFMPQMHPATGLNGKHDFWDVHEHTITYYLFVSLAPPPGHTFSLERDVTGQLPATCPGIRVDLECMCSREQLVGDMPCFLHHADGKLPRDQSSYLLRNLCTRSYLDVEKVACWVQGLVRSAWLLLPQSHRWQLTVLPSSQSCRFQLIGISNMNICTEIILTQAPT